MKIDYLIHLQNRLPFLCPKINTLIITVVATRSSCSYILRREKRQVNKSDFSRSGRRPDRSLKLLSSKRMQDDTLNRLVSRRNSYPPETRKMWKVSRTFIVIYAFKLFARSISWLVDTFEILIHSYLEQLYDLFRFCSNDEGTAGIKCAEKKRFRV